MRNAFFNKLYEVAQKDRDVVLICADMGAPSLDQFRDNLPLQHYNVGIAEQNMVALATGLALSGKKVYTYAIIPFATLRCYELIKVDITLMNLPITIVGFGSGFSHFTSGPTHHSTEDIAVMRALPDMTILNPSDSIMIERFAEITYKMKTPCYVRVDREKLPNIYQKNQTFSEGITRLRYGEDICIIATGNMVHKALEISNKLSECNVNTGVVDLYRVKPVNAELLIHYIRDSDYIVTLEEHLLNGGIGSIVIEILADNSVIKPIKRFGIDDKYYYAYGSRADIQKKCGLDVDTVTESILGWLK